MNPRVSIFTTLAIVALAAPSFAAAQSVQALFVLASQLLNALIGIMITLAIVVFFWGLVKYLLSGGATEDAHKGIHQMIWGVVAIFVMVSIWGLIALLQRTFQVENKGAILPSTVPLRWGN